MVHRAVVSMDNEETGVGGASGAEEEEWAPLRARQGTFPHDGEPK